jgi:uroporphyrin-III C-methyltransferase/precorrin-2 dehydrogenase/sirohydrochlorin ferrochelatase
MNGVPELLPAFLKLEGRRVLLVGGGRVAASKLPALLRAGADVTVVSPDVVPEISAAGVVVHRRAFVESDLDGVWYVVSAATPDVNRHVGAAAEARRLFVNAVDDPRHATAYAAATVRRGYVTLAVSTGGRAPGLAALIARGVERLLPEDLERWLAAADSARAGWRANGTPMTVRSPLLLRAINELYERVGTVPDVQPFRAADAARRPEGLRDGGNGEQGFVSIVGGGPGDPELLTQRAIDRLRAADLVLADGLVPAEVKRLAWRADVRVVAKRAGDPQVSQRDISRLMIDAARAGRRIVRLKAGDPFVLGRGGEEAMALVDAGVAFEIVPGVTSAVAAPEEFGIPVTHRGVSSAFVVVSGHGSAAFQPVLESLEPHSATVVVLMGLATRGAVSSLLLARGWSPATPAAVILAAGTPAREAWFGTLEDLGSARIAADGRPATIVVGEVVALRSQVLPDGEHHASGQSGDVGAAALVLCGRG